MASSGNWWTRLKTFGVEEPPPEPTLLSQFEEATTLTRTQVAAYRATLMLSSLLFNRMFGACLVLGKQKYQEVLFKIWFSSLYCKTWIELSDGVCRDSMASAYALVWRCSSSSWYGFTDEYSLSCFASYSTRNAFAFLICKHCCATLLHWCTTIDLLGSWQSCSDVMSVWALLGGCNKICHPLHIWKLVCSWEVRMFFWPHQTKLPNCLHSYPLLAKPSIQSCPPMSHTTHMPHMSIQAKISCH